MYKLFVISYFLIINLLAICQTASFVAPDTICVNQNVSIQNTSVGGTTYYWNFCSGNVGNLPIGQNMGNLGNLNGPVYIALVNENNEKFSFTTNHLSGTLTRNHYGSSYLNTPTSVNLGSLGGVIDNQVEGIQIVKDNGTWYGLLTGGLSNYIIRLNFGASLFNTPVATNLGNIGNALSYPHTIYAFQEGGNWYALVGDYNISTLIRLNFGNSLANTPTATNLGNIGSLNGPVGFYPVQKNGLWHLFVVNRNGNSLSRLDFGNSLINTPTGISFGNINSLLFAPRSITVIQDCDEIYGLIVNETTNDLVRITFPNGLTNIPSGISLGNIANFSFPHHISTVFRDKDTLYAFIPNVSNNTMSRIYFPSCNNSSILSSNLQIPPVYSYNTAGIFNINLAVNDNLPTQSNYCHPIVVINPPTAQILGDTALCKGDSIKLFSNATPGCTYQWTGPDGFSSSASNIIIPYANLSNSGVYSLIVSIGGCSSSAVSLTVNINNSPLVNLGNDINICTDNGIGLNANNPGSAYLWNTGQTSQSISVASSGIYSVVVTNNGCSDDDTIQVNLADSISVNLGNDTSFCQLEESLLLDAGNPGSQYLWSTGVVTQSIEVTTSGTYWVSASNNDCHDSDTIIINMVPLPLIFLGNDAIICEGELLILSAGFGFENYQWSDGSTLEYLAIEEPGIYSVTAFIGACSASDEISIGACGSEIWVPNAFSPNGDGLNDFFFPVSFNIDEITFYIYNRWGNQIFKGSGNPAMWDGNYLGIPCPAGVYCYLIQYEKSGPQVLVGSVTILR